MGAACAYAEDAAAVGAVELDFLTHIFTGNLGLILGLGIVIVGIWKVALGDTIQGIILVVLAVLITLLPQVYNGLHAIVCPIASSLGGHCGSTTSGG
jgi:uncharacterized membrane protein YiaA